MKNNHIVSASAPGKLLLLGEHAVVYGYPSIVTAVDTRLTVTIEESNDVSGIEIDAPGVSDTRFVRSAIDGIKKHWSAKLPNMIIHTKSDFSSLYGFGSSSAVTVATIFAVRELLGMQHKTLREVFEVAYEAVLDVQKGKGSGFDVAAATLGGTLYYGDGGKVCEPLDAPSIPLIVGYTGIKADTTSLINEVAEKKKQYPDKVDRIFQAIGELASQAKERLEEQDWERLGTLMNFNQEYLRDLGVSSEKLETLIKAARSEGAFGAKLSGAGGGDCMVALYSGSDSERVAIEKAITQSGGEVLRVSSDAAGVRIDPQPHETTDDQKELFIVVDDNDAIVGYKTRYECHHDPSLLHRTVGAVIFNDKGELLLQKRSMTKDMDPGLWGISVAGHVTKGQTDDESISREMKEELGVHAPLTFITKFITRDPRESERAVIYKGIYNGPFTPHPQEISELRFFDLPKLRELIHRHKIQLTSGAKKTLDAIGVWSS